MTRQDRAVLVAADVNGPERRDENNTIRCVQFTGQKVDFPPTMTEYNQLWRALYLKHQRCYLQ